MAEVEFKNIAPGVKIPVLGLGTWKMGGVLTADRSRDSQYIEAIQYAIQKGITHIDTAEIYGAGHTEELVGEVIKKFPRKNIFITTKVSPHHLSYNNILEACERSLNRLDTSYIDLYLIHWPNPLASMKNAMAAFDELILQKLIRFIGVSNFSVRQLTNAQKYAKNKIVTNQVHYSLLYRDPEKELLDFCLKEKVILTAYTPLETGELARSGFEALDKITKKYKKTPAQVSLRWLIEKPQVIVVPKASSENHIDELLGSLDWKLKKEDQEFLSEEFV